MTKQKWVVHLKRWVRKYFRVEYFLPNILIPLVILSVYSSSFTIICVKYITEGINSIFSGALFVILLPFIISLLIIYLILFIKKLIKGEKISFKLSSKKSWDVNFLLLVLPLTPVIQYILNNLDILSWVDRLIIVFLFVMFCGLYIYVFPFMFRKISPIRASTSIGMAFVTTITSMPSLIQEFNWYVESKIYIPLVFFAGILIFTWIMYNTKFKKVCYIFMVINLIVNSSIQLFSKDSVNKLNTPIDDFEENKLLSLIDDRLPPKTPNIYFLVYESYVPNETMRGYGIDNSAQEEYLREQGFIIYPNVYSVGSPSIESLSRVFNVSTEFYGKKRRSISGNGVVQNIFKNFGYKTFGISANDWIFLGMGSSYDYSFPETEKLASYELLSLAILHGELSFDLIFEDVSHEKYIETKQIYLRMNFNNPVLFYSHSDFPGHSTMACSLNEINLYEEGLLVANHEMEQDIKTIKEMDPGAIIVIAGDHGPYITKSCFKTGRDYDISEISRLDIQDRFATFIAIKWPTIEYKKFDNIVVLQDLFPVIFTYIFDDSKILDSKIEPDIIDTYQISGVTVKNGIIYGGINDGESLFLSGKR